MLHQHRRPSTVRVCVSFSCCVLFGANRSPRLALRTRREERSTLAKVFRALFELHSKGSNLFIGGKLLRNFAFNRFDFLQRAGITWQRLAVVGIGQPSCNAGLAASVPDFVTVQWRHASVKITFPAWRSADWLSCACASVGEVSFHFGIADLIAIASKPARARIRVRSGDMGLAFKGSEPLH